MSEYKQTFPEYVSNSYGLDCIPVCELLELYIPEGTGMAQLGENTKIAFSEPQPGWKSTCYWLTVL